MSPDDCRAAVAAHGRALGASAAKGNLNRSAITGLIEGFVDAPAYSAFRYSRGALQELIELGCKAARNEMEWLSK